MKDKIDKQIQMFDTLYKVQDNFYRKAAQWAGLSDAAFWILYRLCTVQDILSQSDLCKEWCFSKQTINSAVAKLIALDYIVLTNVMGGGTKKQLKITENGKIICEKYITPILEAERKSYAVLTDEERNLWIQLMKKQLDALYNEAEELWE